jgi:integrase
LLRQLNVWIVRTGQGGEPRGHFDGSDDAKALYAAGWPKDVRPYQARHSVALELGERGIDLGDVQGWLGYRQVSTTRRHYAPVLASRLKQRESGRALPGLEPGRRLS